MRWGGGRWCHQHHVNPTRDEPLLWEHFHWQHFTVNLTLGSTGARPGISPTTSWRQYPFLFYLWATMWAPPVTRTIIIANGHAHSRFMKYLFGHSMLHSISNKPERACCVPEAVHKDERGVHSLVGQTRVRWPQCNMRGSDRGARGVQQRKPCHWKEMVQDELEEQVLNWVLEDVTR